MLLLSKIHRKKIGISILRNFRVPNSIAYKEICQVADLGNQCPKLNYENEIKGRVQCFSMLVLLNNCFLLNPEKNLSVLSFSRKTQKRTFNSEKRRQRAEG